MFFHKSVCFLLITCSFLVCTQGAFLEEEDLKNIKQRIKEAYPDHYEYIL